MTISHRLASWLGYTALVGVLSLSAGCAKDEPDASRPIIGTLTEGERNDLDRWLEAYYLRPYNIALEYRLKDNETDMDYRLAPVDYTQAVRFAHLVKYFCLEAYDEVTGSKDFIRSLFPKTLQLIGSYNYTVTGNVTLGQAEGGRKIVLYGINNLNMSDADALELVFHTIHHEFGHIQNQTKPFPTAFRQITASGYVAQTWANHWGGDSSVANQITDEAASPAIRTYNATDLNLYNQETDLRKRIDDLRLEKFDLNDIIGDFASSPEEVAQAQARLQEIDELLAQLQPQLTAIVEERAALSQAIVDTDEYKDWLYLVNVVNALASSGSGYGDLKAMRSGFISAYASADADEDFVELQATYIMSSERMWQTLIKIAGTEGGAIITSKMDMVKAYLQEKWNIDIDALRRSVQTRRAQIAGLDLENLDLPTN